MKIRPMVTDLFHVDIRTDIQTDMTMLTVAIRSFAQGPKVQPFHYRTVNFKKWVNLILEDIDTNVLTNHWRL